jgi:hypothetical protein
MPNFVSPLIVAPHDLQSFVNPATDPQPVSLGTQAIDEAGNRYRYARAGALLTVGNALQASVPVPNHQATTAAAAAVGDTTLTMTLGATLATANQYAEGFAIVYVTPGNGYKYRIKSHPAAAQSASLTVTLYSDNPVVVALTTASKISLVANPYADVIQTPVTTLTGAVVGGACAPIPSGYCGWIQTGGVFAGLIDGTPAVGQSLSCPAAVAGGFAINSGTLAIVATAMIVGVDTKNQQILLNLP